MKTEAQTTTKTQKRKLLQEYGYCQHLIKKSSKDFFKKLSFVATPNESLSFTEALYLINSGGF